jgi:hypothetical protein
MKNAPLIASAFLAVTACSPEMPVESTAPDSDYRFMTAVSDEVIIDSEPTLDENTFKGFEIIRAVCEGGFYSVSCASPRIVPPMKIDRDNLVPVELMVNLAAYVDPNYVYIRCDSDVSPPPAELVQECHRLVVEQVRISR